MTSKSEGGTGFPLPDIGGRARLNLLGGLACSLLAFGFLLLLQTPVQAFVSKGTSCSASSCHGASEATATISVALNGAQGTAITVSPGSTFEVDWLYTNLRNTTKYDGTQPEIAIPTGWTVARGTSNSPSLTGWSTTWDQTGGVTSGWNTTYSTAGEFPNSQLGYSIDYNGTSWDSGTRNAASDNGSAGDLDGVANKMGADARITVPTGATPGTYTVMVLGIGHNSSDTKAHIEQAITVTVSAGISQTITVGTPAPASAAYNSQFTVAAAASSGLPVTYSSGSTGICTNSGATFTMVSGTGTCLVQYDQAGGSGYAAAPRVTNNVTATKINQATVSVSAPTNATYGQTGLSATASGGSGTGAYSYSAGSSTACTVNASSGALTITSGTGSCSITATRATDSNYNVSAASSPATVTISKATQAAVTVSAPANATYGQIGLSATASGGSGTGAYSYDAGSSTACTVSPATGALTITSGTGSCSITATRATDNNYNVSAASTPTTVTINKADPTVSAWPTASAITYGQTLAASILTGGTASTGGTFAFTTPATAPNAGTASQSVTFTPTDTTNYNSATGSVSVTVNKADPTVSAWPTAGAITYGQTLAASTLTGGTASTGGTFAFTTPATAPNAGTAAQGVTFTPTDTANYNSATGSVSVTVNKADPTVSAWPTAGAITYGQTLAASTLTGGTASTVGTFAFTTPATAPNAGTAAQGVTFTPTDTANYNSATGSVSVTVNKADQTITFGALANKTYGDAAFTLTATGGASGNPVTFTSSNEAVATVSGTTVTIIGAGITTITASQAGDANYNAANNVFQPLTVDRASQTITFAALTSKNVGEADFAPGATTTSNLTITYVSSNTAVATIVGGMIHIVGPGSTDITASQSGDTNYYAATDVVQPLTVTAAGNPTLNVTISGNGSVNSVPSGIACTGGTCSADFTSGQSVDLTAATSWNYEFTGWIGGACDGTTTNPCTVVVNSPTDVTATFTAKQLVKLPGGNYPSVQEAYAAAIEGETMQLRDQTFSEDLDFNRTVQVKLDGGWNADYTSVSGNTTIDGTVTISSGGITISNVIIQ